MIGWQPYLIAIVVGLLVGIERERSHPYQKILGVRTFLLLSLLGAFAGGVSSPTLSALLTVFSLGLILLAYFNQTRLSDPKVDRGLTTEFAAGMVFCLGYAAHSSPALSAVLGPIIALILFSKKTLHRFTYALKPSEIEAALFLLLGFVVLVNLVPNRVIDPWGVFNPRKFGTLVLLLALLEFSSYVLAKVFTTQRSTLLVGFFGGLVSSTAVFLSAAQNAKRDPSRWQQGLQKTIVAKLASLLELLLIVAMASTQLLYALLTPLLVCMSIGLLLLIVFLRRHEALSSEVALSSPLDWRGVLRLSFLLGGILALVTLAKNQLGTAATLALSFLTGLFELQGVSLANSTLFAQGKLDLNTAVVSILLAVIASLTAKLTLAYVLARNRYSLALNMFFLPMIVFLIAYLLLWLPQ